MSASRLSLSRLEHGSTWMAKEPEGNAENLKTDSLKEELHDLALKALFSLIRVFITSHKMHTFYRSKHCHVSLACDW